MAGGGTGDTTAFLGEQLNHTNEEIVYLDFSISSMKIAQSRAKNRNIKNIILVKRSKKKAKQSEPTIPVPGRG